MLFGENLALLVVFLRKCDNVPMLTAQYSWWLSVNNNFSVAFLFFVVWNVMRKRNGWSTLHTQPLKSEQKEEDAW